MSIIQKQHTVRKSQTGFIERTNSSNSCTRCGGLMVPSFCISPDQGTWDFQILIGKCIQCGDMVDATILKHRQQSHLQLSIN